MRCSDTPFRDENRVSLERKGIRGQAPCSDTPLLTEKHVSRTGIRCGGCGSCSDTPFHEKKPVSRARRGRKRRTEATPHCTTQYDHPTKPHHIISHHIQTRQHYQQTNPIPYLKHHTPLYNKKLLPQNRRKSFIDLSANRLSQQSLEATRVPTRGQMRRGWRRLTP